MVQHPDLAILGVYPPPPGGVAKHVERLCAQLRRRGIGYVVYNAVSDTESAALSVRSVSRHRMLWFLSYLARGREPVVYVLSDRLFVWVGVAVMARSPSRRVVIRLRNSALEDWRRSAPMKYWVARRALRAVDGVVAVSERLKSEAEEAGVDPARIRVAPGFLPPVDEYERPDLVDEGVWAFMGDHRPVVAASGRAGARYGGVSLYGFDLLVDLAAALQSGYPQLGIVVCLWSHETEADEVALAQLRQRAAAVGIAEKIYFNTRAGPFVPVVKRADLLVRPTNTDGDANSIREALFYGVPVVASDVVDRPAGTRPFRNRDLAELIDVVSAVLAQPPQLARNAASDVDLDGYVEFVLKGA